VIRRALDHLPESLDETYDRILQSIAQERQEFAQHLFQCLAESIRPLYVEEFADILAIEFETGAIPKYHVNWRPENPEEEVLSICSSLITIVDMDGSRVVRFSHFSVKEYLTSQRLIDAGKGLSDYHILSHSAHTILAKASLSVLLALDDRVNKDSMKNYPLAVYAARYWAEHAKLHDISSRIKDAVERLFDPDKPHFATWVWIHDIDYSFRESMFTEHPSPPTATPLYYATLCGFRDLVEHLIVAHPGDINARGGYHVTALHVAVIKGHVDIMRLLLEHGADVATLNNENFDPLYEASRRGRLDVIGLLLDHHADVNSRNVDESTPLIMASQEGELEVARVLLQHGADANSREKSGWIPLMSASKNGHLDIVRLLLQNGATVDSHENGGWVSLMVASEAGHADIVRLLLQNGAAVDSHNNNGRTSLMFASQKGHLDVVHLLLENGAAVDTRANCWSSLTLASERGHPDVVRLLLENGAPADSCGDHGWTPLMFASCSGNLDIVRLLLQNCASVDSRNNDGCTSLILASQNGRLDVVHLLLQNGAAVDSHDYNGWTSLMFASRGGHLDVVHLLLQNSAAVDPRHDDGQISSSGSTLPYLFTSCAAVQTDTLCRLKPGWMAPRYCAPFCVNLWPYHHCRVTHPIWHRY
jgi:ankyrin repeat protein